MAEKLLKEWKPFTDNEVFKSCFIATLEELCLEKVKQFPDTSLSEPTLSQWIEDVGNIVHEQLKEKEK